MTPVRLGFVPLPRFSLLTLGGALEALRATNEVLGEAAYQPLLLSVDGQPVPDAGGLPIPAQALAGAPPLEALFVVADGALPVASPAAAVLHEALRQQAAAGRLLGGLGTGGAVLAAAGVLDGHRATLPWAHLAQVAERHPRVVFSSNLYELDRQRLTAAGGTAALDGLLAWLAQRHGERLLQAVLAALGLERLRPADERQPAPLASRLGASSAKLEEAVALMQANLGEPLPTEDIARLVGVSRRQLERLFKQHLDELPSRYYAELRLVRARRLLQQTPQSILQIGLACGFSSGSHFSNAYRARFGHTPRDERSQRAAAWQVRTEETPDGP